MITAVVAAATAAATAVGSLRFGETAASIGGLAVVASTTASADTAEVSATRAEPQRPVSGAAGDVAGVVVDDTAGCARWTLGEADAADAATAET